LVENGGADVVQVAEVGALAEGIREAWSNVGVVARKQASLTNQLIDVVKGYQDAENLVMLKVSESASMTAIQETFKQSGAVLAVAMVVFRRAWKKHAGQLWMIVGEILTIRDPGQLSTIAAERKSSMLLLPYGIPIAIGSIAYFVWMGMLV
jgi:hypothetical protein